MQKNKKNLVLFCCVFIISISFGQKDTIFNRLKVIQLPFEWKYKFPDKNYWSPIFSQEIRKDIFCYNPDDCNEKGVGIIVSLGQKIFENEKYLFFTYNITDTHNLSKTYLTTYNKDSRIVIGNLLLKTCLMNKLIVYSVIDKDLNVIVKRRKLMPKGKSVNVIEEIETFEISEDGRIKSVGIEKKKAYKAKTDIGCNWEG